MKSKFLVAMIFTTISLSFMGCTTSEDAIDNVENLPINDIISGNEIYSYIDPETGVNYLIYDGYRAGGMTIRLNADGTPYVTPLDEISEE